MIFGLTLGWMRLRGGTVGKFIKALEVVDLRIADRLFLNLFDHPLQDAEPHSQLLNAKGGQKPRQKIEVDLDILQSLGSILAMFPEFLEVFFNVVQLGLKRIAGGLSFFSRHCSFPSLSSLITQYHKKGLNTKGARPCHGIQPLGNSRNLGFLDFHHPSLRPAVSHALPLHQKGYYLYDITEH